MQQTDATAELNISTNISSTAIPPDKFNLSDYLLKNYIIIVIPSVLLGIFLIVMFIILIRKLINRNKFDLKQLETYSSVNYDEESLDEELGIHDDVMYTSCRLLVGEDFENNGELTNSEAEYDSMSIDVNVTANQSAIVNWGNKENSPEPSQDISHSLKALPHNFWKR